MKYLRWKKQYEEKSKSCSYNNGKEDIIIRSGSTVEAKDEDARRMLSIFSFLEEVEGKNKISETEELKIKNKVGTGNKVKK